MARRSEGRLVPLSRLARSPLLGRRRTNATVLFRWAMEGRNGVRLRTEDVDGAVCSSPLWLKEFIRDSGLCGTPQAAENTPRPADAAPRKEAEP